IARLRRMQFGRSSEKIARAIEQFELKLEELETETPPAVSEATAAQAEAGTTLEQPSSPQLPKSARRALPAHLPARDVVHAPSCACPVCGRGMRKGSEAVTESRLHPRPLRGGQACAPGVLLPAPAAASWPRRSVMPAPAGRRSRATSMTAPWRSATTPPSAPSARSRSAARTICSPAPMPAASAPPRRTRSSKPPSSTASIRKLSARGDRPHRRPSHQPRRRAAALEHRLGLTDPRRGLIPAQVKRASPQPSRDAYEETATALRDGYAFENVPRGSRVSQNVLVPGKILVEYQTILMAPGPRSSPSHRQRPMIKFGKKGRFFLAGPGFKFLYKLI